MAYNYITSKKNKKLQEELIIVQLTLEVDRIIWAENNDHIMLIANVHYNSHKSNVHIGF